MFELIREDQVAAKFRKLTRQGDAIVIAVPFWGKGATRLLGLKHKMPLRIVCNLDHPGCNPDAIEEIRKLGIKIRTHPRLHAKIYATEHGAIVGSSNVSSNGLCVEGTAARGWIEANTFSSDPNFAAQVLSLFEQEIWGSDEARPVKKADIDEARRKRALVPPFLLGSSTSPRTLLAACRQNPEAFASVYVAAYTEGLSFEGARKLKAVQSGASPANTKLGVADFKNAWGYEIEGIPEDAWLIDLNCKTQGKERVQGCSRATGLRLSTEEGVELTVSLRQLVSIGGQTFRISGEEKDSLARAGRKFLAWSEGGLIPLSQAILIMDRPANGRKAAAR